MGSTMHLNPHGDAAIYDTMVRMGRSATKALLVPFVDSKGNFGKAYSRHMSYAAARYTEAKLESRSARSCSATSTKRLSTLCPTTTAPPRSPPCCPLPSRPFWPTTRWASPLAWHPTSAPSIWRNCSERDVALMKDEHHDIGTTMPAPDFVGGGRLCMMKRRCVKFTRMAAAA